MPSVFLAMPSPQGRASKQRWHPAKRKLGGTYKRHKGLCKTVGKAIHNSGRRLEREPQWCLVCISAMKIQFLDASSAQCQRQLEKEGWTAEDCGVPF